MRVSISQSIARMLWAAGLVLPAACQVSPGSGPQTAPVSRPRLFKDMGNHHRPVSTTSPQAQRFFDQGLIWSIAFNHDEAIRSFEEAGRLDPDCAMAWWGVALCNGPHINNPIMPAERSQRAWAALQKAQALRAKAVPAEQALIDALASRYADPAPANRRPLDEAYAAAMRSVWQQYRQDDDIAVLFVEALMDLQPWDLWTPDGQPKGNTNEILRVLEEVLARAPEHPGACHLYIHATESSPFPEKADAAANQLRTAVPAAGHLVHMPSHTDVQLGRWSLAADQNRAAIKADRRYRALSPSQGFYHVYMAHNHHFLAFASMMEGRRAEARKAARELIAGVPEEILKSQPAMVDPYLMVELDVLKRFGEWDTLLQQPQPPATLPITTAFWHYSRGIARAARKDVAGARSEQKAFRAAVERVPADALMAINSARKVLSIGEHVLAGEIALAERRLDDSVAELTEAVRIEDDLLYMEPPEWIQPARHTLGAVLVSAKRYADAEAVYREDLKRWPENGWSLHGLATCLQARGAAEEARQVQARFRKVWRRADVKIGSSCLCVGADET